MGKKSGTSWLTAVKRAFRSPTKDSEIEKKSCRRKVDHQRDEEVKKSERRRWLFKKHSNNSSEANKDTTTECIAPGTPRLPAEQRHAKAAAEIIRVTQPSAYAASARVIQTAFRGYLARRALIALKGIVKLQALIRGQNVRKQANMTMKCMQSLLRVQARVRDQRARLSHDAGRRSMFAESSNLWESKSLRNRKSRSREGSCVTDEWRPLEAILKTRNEAALAHEKSLAFAFAQQNNIFDCDRSGDENSDVGNRAICLDKWMATKQWETSRRDYRRRYSIKTRDIDSLRTSSFSATNGRKSRCQSPIHRHSVASPHHRPIQTPKTRTPLLNRPPSPRCQSYSTANTPSLRSTQRINSSTFTLSDGTAPVPNYMATTESTKARIRSHSAPRQRPWTPERDRSTSAARKRLFYPIPESYCVNLGFGCNNNNILIENLRSPSFKSVRPAT